ncbi:4201_t:CDS:2, partial [Cetraspora pellucida]
KRITICPNSVCHCDEKLEVIEDCEHCKNNTKCEEEYMIICDDCLHEVLEREFVNWSSGNLQIDEFIRKAQQSLPYSRYPEWIPYNCFTEIKIIIRGELGAIISAKWSQGVKRIQNFNNERYHIRSDPCAVVLKKFINQSLLIETQLQDRSDCCCLYGITQDPSTLEYILVEPTYLCDSCLSNWSSGNLLIDEFIGKARLSSSYSRYPEWIPYNYFIEIKYINRGELGAIISAKWSQGVKKIQRSNNNNKRYYIRSDPCMVVLKFINRFSLIEKQLQDRSDCCCLYGITQDPLTLEYMFVEPTHLCDNCLHRVLKSEFSNWTSESLQIDGFIQQDKFHLISSGFGAAYSARWDKGIKSVSIIDGDKYYTRSDPCTVALKQLKSEKDSVHILFKEIQAQFNCCHLYGVTKNPSTSQYMFVMRYAPQSDLRRFLQKKFDKLTLENKLNIAQSICTELQNIHDKGWVHGDLHCGNILLLNEEDAFISDFGLCRPVNEAQMTEKKFYGVIPNMAPEILRCQSPYSQAGDIYSLGIILWELACGIPAFSNRAHDANLIINICDGLRPKTCHFVPPTYNDMLRKYWDQNPLERPTIAMVLDLIQLLCRRINDRELLNSHNATITYNLMKWKPDIPIHPNAVYKSRVISVNNGYKTRQSNMAISLHYEISDI